MLKLPKTSLLVLVFIETLIIFTVDFPDWKVALPFKHGLSLCFFNSVNAELLLNVSKSQNKSIKKCLSIRLACDYLKSK